MSGEQEVQTGVGPLPSALPSAPGPVPATVEQPVVRRIGRAEREATEQRLRQALADDVLTITEFDERLGEVMAARTQLELDRVVADLPDDGPPPAPPGPPLRPQNQLVAFMSGTEQRGRWRPGRPVRAVAVMGGVEMDLREAESDDGVFDVDAVAVMGGVEVIVPDNAHVEMSGFAIMGGRENKVPTPTGPGPLVRVQGHAMMGGVVVRTASTKERKRYPVADKAPAPGPTRQPPPRTRGWTGRIIALAVIGLIGAGPVRAFVQADARAMFGSTVVEAEPGTEVDVFAMFGSVEVVVPEGARGRNDVTAVFGSADCESACTPSDLPVVTVDGAVLFGSAEIVRPGEVEVDD